MPDQAFAIDEHLYRRLGRRFEAELALWGASDDIHMAMIATFGVSSAGVPAIHELCLMPVTRQWLPIGDAFDKQLVETLVREKRSFVKGLNYNLARRTRVAKAVLTDCDGPPPMLAIIGPDDSAVMNRAEDSPSRNGFAWIWRPQLEELPPLPRSSRL